MRYIDETDIHNVVERLRSLNVPFALIGGSAVGYLIESDYSARPTMDVDVVVEAATHMEYSKLEEKLPEAGFCHNLINDEDETKPPPRCSWRLDDPLYGIRVDILPTSPNAAEFGSAWFEEAFQCLEKAKTVNGTEFYVIGPAYLLATKLDAFFSRGNSDYQRSEDMEDIITLAEGCPQLLDSLRNASNDLRHYVAGRVSQLLSSTRFLESIAGLISQQSPTGTDEVVTRMLSAIAGIGRK